MSSQNVSEQEAEREPESDSCQSPAWSSEHEEVDFSESMDSDDQDYSDNSDCTQNPVLVNDYHLLKEHCRNSTICHRSLTTIHEMDMEIAFPTLHLGKMVAEAWGLNYGEPIIVNLCLDQHYYLDVDAVNRIDVFQKGHSKKSGVLLQLKTIVEEFCRKQFRELSNEKVKSAVEENSDDSSLFEGKACDVQQHKEESMSPPPLQQAKEIPSLKRGFLVQFYCYIEQRLLTLNSFCPICDNPHSMTICMMLKPVVCSNALCIFSYQTLGVMADAEDSIVNEPQVVNLLILLTWAAVKSSRNALILTPYPTIVHPRLATEMALHPQTKNFELMDKILEKVPNVEELLRYDQTEIKKILNEKDELCYPLLRWIISSNRSHIVKLSSAMQLAFMGTPHQFLMRNSPPLEDKQFRIYKEKYGSIFAFHGSPIENWHSIVREGLIVASGTNKMIHGAACGAGIYLSPFLMTSMSYCSGCGFYSAKQHISKGIPNDYIQGGPEQLTCITLCEVINGPNLQRHSDQIWTCAKSEYVCTRFFFVYDESVYCKEPDPHTNTTSPAIHQQVEQAIAANLGT